MQNLNRGKKVFVKCEKATSGANPTIVSYNACVVNFYSATGSLARFENKFFFILL
jgi:hypothetical protein